MSLKQKRAAATSHASLSCQSTRGQNLGWQIRRQFGPCQWPTWTYGKHFFPSLLNLGWELCLWEKNQHLLSDHHAQALNSLSYTRTLGIVIQYLWFFVFCFLKRNLGKFSKSPNIPTPRNTWLKRKSSLFGLKPTCCLWCCLERRARQSEYHWASFIRTFAEMHLLHLS